MRPEVFCSRHDAQILWDIVSLVAINVMNNQTWRRSRNQSVLIHLPPIDLHRLVRIHHHLLLRMVFARAVVLEPHPVLCEAIPDPGCLSHYGIHSPFSPRRGRRCRSMHFAA